MGTHKRVIGVGLGVGIPEYILGRKDVCNECVVLKVPAPVAPASVTPDVEFTVTGAIYGGDFFGLGELGCPNVSHEIVICEFSGDPDVTGIQLDAWAEDVLESSPVSRPVTMTTAQHTALGSPAVIEIYIFSYTCSGNRTGGSAASAVV